MRDKSRIHKERLKRKSTTFRVKSNRKNMFNTVYNFEVIEIDGCEYLIGTHGYGGFMTHKGNCKFCAERNTTR